MSLTLAFAFCRRLKGLGCYFRNERFFVEATAFSWGAMAAAIRQLLCRAQEIASCMQFQTTTRISISMVTNFTSMKEESRLAKPFINYSVRESRLEHALVNYYLNWLFEYWVFRWIITKSAGLRERVVRNKMQNWFHSEIFTAVMAFASNGIFIKLASPLGV